MSATRALALLVLLLASPAWGEVVFESSFNTWSPWTVQQSTSESQSCYSGCGLTDWTGYNQGMSQCAPGITSDPGNNSIYVNGTAGYPDASDTCRGGSGLCITKWQEACDSGDAFDDADANLGVDLGQEYADLYVQFWIKIPTSFQFVEWQSFKVMHVQHWAGDATPWNYFERDTNNQPVFVGVVRLGDGGYIDVTAEARGYTTYETHNFMIWRIGQYSALLSDGLVDGDWHSLEWHMHRNSSVGATDGYVDLWVDGVLQSELEGYEATGIDWTDSGGDLRGFRFVSVLGNNMAWTTACTDGSGDMVADGCEQWYGLDDVVVSTTYIGPGYVIGGTPDPNDVDDDEDGYTENQGDCNDSSASIYPGATETCGDGIDQDCSGGDLLCAGTPRLRAASILGAVR